MNTRYVGVWAVAAILAMGVNSAGEKAPTPKDDRAPVSIVSKGHLDQDPLTTKVRLSGVKGGDVVKAFTEIIAQTPAFSFEILRTPQDVKPYRVEGFALAQGEYTISQILEGIRSKTTAVTWNVVDCHVYARIRVSQDFPDPMDREVPDYLKGPFTRLDIILWLNEKVPDLRLMFAEIQLGEVPLPRQEVSILRGAKVREVITQIGNAWGVGWGAEVYSQPREIHTMDPMTGNTKNSSAERIKLIFGKGLYLMQESNPA